MAMTSLKRTAKRPTRWIHPSTAKFWVDRHTDSMQIEFWFISTEFDNMRETMYSSTFFIELNRYSSEFLFITLVLILLRQHLTMDMDSCLFYCIGYMEEGDADHLLTFYVFNSSAYWNCQDIIT